MTEFSFIKEWIAAAVCWSVDPVFECRFFVFVLCVKIAFLHKVARNKTASGGGVSPAVARKLPHSSQPPPEASGERRLHFSSWLVRLV